MTAPLTPMEQAVAETRGRVALHPRVALVLGSGLGGFVETFDQAQFISYDDIPGMKPVSVAGHQGRLAFGLVGRTPVVAMQGRLHLYEGHSPEEVVFGTRLMLHLGASTFVVTNAAGGVDESFRPGDLMAIEDHLNLTGQNCLLGPNRNGGSRFLDLTEAYSSALRERALATAAELSIPLKRGVYAGLLGPSYETPAEVRMLRTLGAHAVGMSTVLEVIAARQLGARVLGISCITNQAAGVTNTPLSHDEVTEVAAQAREPFAALVASILRSLTVPSEPT